jgi:hypothetical protein
LPLAGEEGPRFNGVFFKDRTVIALGSVEIGELRKVAEADGVPGMGRTGQPGGQWQLCPATRRLACRAPEHALFLPEQTFFWNKLSPGTSSGLIPGCRYFRCVLIQPGVENKNNNRTHKSEHRVTQTQTQPATEVAPSDCIVQTIMDFVLPFFLAGAGGNADVAREAIFELLDSYNAVTMQELDLAGRIIIFSTTAMDNLRLSMTDPEMSDAKKLRYRSNAVALSRSAEQCRVIMDAMQVRRQSAPARNESARVSLPAAAERSPVPAVVDASSKTVQPAAPVAQKARLAPSMEQPVVAMGSGITDAEIDKMKLEARIMIHALHKAGGPLSASVDPNDTDPFAAATAAAHAALAAAGFQKNGAAATGSQY